MNRLAKFLGLAIALLILATPAAQGQSATALRKAFKKPATPPAKTAIPHTTPAAIKNAVTKTPPNPTSPLGNLKGLPKTPKTLWNVKRSPKNPRTPDTKKKFLDVKLKRSYDVPRSRSDADRMIRTHDKKTQYLRSKDDGFWYTKDRAGHGGHGVKNPSAWKVYQEEAKGLKHVADLDRTGTVLENKHKGPVGKFIRFKDHVEVHLK
jgi:hypothetical protein